MEPDILLNQNQEKCFLQNQETSDIILRRLKSID